MINKTYSSISTKPYFESLHEDINSGDIDDISRTISRYPSERYFFNPRIESAALVALKRRRLEIYELLISKGAHLGPAEDLNNVIVNYSSSEKIKIREIHKKYSKHPISGYIEVLTSRSKLSHDTRSKDQEKCFQLIRNAYEEISEFMFVKPILQLVSRCESLNIIFDFNRSTISTVDPTKEHYVTATSYYLRGEIYVGAHLLLSNDSSEVLATLAHELCHFAMYMVYRNGCKPYFKDDEMKRSQFGEILRKCEKNQRVASAVQQVYQCPDDKQHAELIVAAPFLVIYYRNSPEKYFECIETFPELFEYFEKNSLSDLKIKYNSLMSHEKLQKISSFHETESMLQSLKVQLEDDEVKKLLNVDDNASHVSSNCPLLTFKLIYMKSKSNDDKFAYVFNTLEAMNNDFVIKQVKEVVESYLFLKIVVMYEEHEVSQNLQSFVRKLVDNSLIQVTILVTHSSLASSEILSLNFHKVDVLHHWDQLTQPAKAELMQRKILFQGFDLKFDELIGRQDANKLKSIPLNDLILKQAIRVGERIEFEKPRFYIERKLSSSAVDRSDDLTFDEIIERNEDGSDVLIYDEPGMGKTTTVQIIATKLKAKYPSKWIQFVDLKSFTEVFPRNKSPPLETPFDFIKFIREKICKTKEFEAEVFEHLFTRNRVKFIFDGFDEICPSHKQFVLKLMKSIQDSKNQLWITSRPHLLKELRDGLSLKVYSLKRLDQNDRTEFLENFFNPHHEPNNVMKIQKIDSFLESESLKENFSNPLLLRMIAEVFEESEVNTNTGINLYSIYNQLVSRLFARSFTKGLEASIAVSRMIANSSPKKILQKISVESIFPEIFTRMSFTDNDVRYDEETSETSNETLTRLGITYADVAGNIQFIHRSFKDFFVADFIARKLFADHKSDENVGLAMELFAEVLKLSSDHLLIEKFIDNLILSINPEDSRRVFDNNNSNHSLNYQIDINKLKQHLSFNLVKILTPTESDERETLIDIKEKSEESIKHPVKLDLRKRETSNVGLEKSSRKRLLTSPETLRTHQKISNFTTKAHKKGQKSRERSRKTL